MSMSPANAQERHQLANMKATIHIIKYKVQLDERNFIKGWSGPWIPAKNSYLLVRDLFALTHSRRFLFELQITQKGAS